jgi:hypothetical protein
MAWTFYNSSGEAMIIDGGVQNPAGANFDISSYKLVGNGGSTGIAISSAGEVTMAAQPAVLANNSVTDSNVTGNGASATIDFDTEIFDQNADFASDTFTAPITGRYFVAISVQASGSTSSAASASLRHVASNRTFNSYSNPGTPDCSNQVSAIVDMDADDQLTAVFRVTGESSDVVDINGSSDMGTRISICLLV